MSTTTIGGFFPLELPSSCGPLPPRNAVLLQSGRACLRAALEAKGSARMVAPFYICDAALSPARALGMSVEFYGIDQSFKPILPALRDDDAVLLVDYFGLCSHHVEDCLHLGSRLVIDQTQALFATGPQGVTRFTSARKWFGVPDGGFLWGADVVAVGRPVPLEHVPVHLVERRWGNGQLAYRAYQQAESEFSCEANPISEATISLLHGVNPDLISDVRRSNFDLLSAQLGEYNRLDFSLPNGVVPFCYPLLPAKAVSRRELAALGIFVPTFWQDCLTREDKRFQWELELSRSLLPLPIDHRYGREEMTRIAETLLGFLA